MLIHCPECNKKISDSAKICPNCGYPMPAAVPSNIPKENKNKRNIKKNKRSNGLGSVYKISRDLKNPWLAVKTIRCESNPETGKKVQKRKVVGYFASKKEAVQALDEFNQSKEKGGLTFSELYIQWSSEYFSTIQASSTKNIVNAYTRCKELYNLAIKDIDEKDLQNVIDHTDGETQKQRIKSLFNLIFGYAVDHKIIERDPSIMCQVTKNRKRGVKSSSPFTEQEIQTLWNHIDTPFVDMVLIGIYSGWQAQELAELQVSDVDLLEHVFTGGRDKRTIPIHPNIYSFVESNYRKALEMNSDFLFNDEFGQQGSHMTYDKYRGRFRKIIKRLNLSPERRPRNTRETFVRLAKKYKVNQNALDSILGDAKDIQIKNIEMLRIELNKIK